MGVLRVGVLGAGVVGLNTALELQKELPTAQLTLLAHKFTTHTTSDGAAGIFEPVSYFIGPDFDLTKQWIADSYKFYDELRNSTENKDAKIFECSGFDFSTKIPVPNRLLQGIVPIYRPATSEELSSFSNQWKFGTFFSTLIIENRYFQPWAMKKFRLAGGSIIDKKILSLEELGADFDVVFNCTGLGSRKLCHDLKVIPIRGQLIKVRAPWIKHFYLDDREAYVIPNHETVTLGGTRHFGSFDLRVSEVDSSVIRANCEAMVPSLSGAEVVRDWVGLRPYRDPVRVEAERLQGAGGRSTLVVHNYGHGACGVTSAPGTAKHAVRLFHQHWRANTKPQSRL